MFGSRVKKVQHTLGNVVLQKPICYDVNLPPSYIFDVTVSITVLFPTVVFVILYFDDNNTPKLKYQDSSWDKLGQWVNFQDQVSKFISHLYQQISIKKKQSSVCSIVSIKSQEKLSTYCVCFEVDCSCIITLYVIFLCENHEQIHGYRRQAIMYLMSSASRTLQCHSNLDVYLFCPV